MLAVVDLLCTQLKLTNAVCAQQPYYGATVLMLQCMAVCTYKGTDAPSVWHVLPAESFSMQLQAMLTFDSSSSAAVQLIFVLRVYVTGTSLLGC